MHLAERQRAAASPRGGALYAYFRSLRRAI